MLNLHLLSFLKFTCCLLLRPATQSLTFPDYDKSFSKYLQYFYCLNICFFLLSIHCCKKLCYLITFVFKCYNYKQYCAYTSKFVIQEVVKCSILVIAYSIFGCIFDSIGRLELFYNMEIQVLYLYIVKGIQHVSNNIFSNSKLQIFISDYIILFRVILSVIFVRSQLFLLNPLLTCYTAYQYSYNTNHKVILIYKYFYKRFKLCNQIFISCTAHQNLYYKKYVNILFNIICYTFFKLIISIYTNYGDKTVTFVMKLFYNIFCYNIIVTFCHCVNYLTRVVVWGFITIYLPYNNALKFLIIIWRYLGLEKINDG